MALYHSGIASQTHEDKNRFEKQLEKIIKRYWLINMTFAADMLVIEQEFCTI
ncbi:putative uncharacterized protein [Parachlamydia acanthamoebae UV-7]|uniref:Uncharacterized protein n=2 Tax=Parachlamydia acanthamoebae TaxID=83552 RepID=F8L1I5_PARAV|nr:hypothetical protein pah_c272o014 [Parachlamydia acanthamoebae str. Hall's coccus]KIA77175.1 hypothetical protein DB43_GT00160 [Parachlamydia acanthamoebae]CCB87127.1 putative uncharacterized protein [Parachlamydia acanthamoebae UV-7]